MTYIQLPEELWIRRVEFVGHGLGNLAPDYCWQAFPVVLAPDVKAWCDANIGSYIFMESHVTMKFDNERDAALFKLFWL